MKCIVFSLMIIPTISFSQINIHGIVCNLNHTPLAYTNIVSVKKQNGATTNEKGEFLLKHFDYDDTIRVTNISYYPQLISVKTLLNSDTIFLSEYTKTLDEVIATNFNNLTDEEDLGFLHLKTNAFFDLKPGGQIAVFIEHKRKSTGWIKTVSFKAKTHGRYKCDIRVRLMEPNATDMSPGFDLLSENIIVAANHLKRTNNINLSKYKILMPKNGVFVALEWLCSTHACDENSCTNILGNMSVSTDLVWFNYRDRKWQHNFRPSMRNGNFTTPNIGIKVAY
ncbi:MAG: carboxypeptidase-like regulatory domain-containing protein [Ferruginibacter sp.]|nr:carboxypeptidase-like regulatory domain-containing protein [Ferruginibacter sp.]